MFRLVASDLDGTLLNAEHRLSKRSKSCLERLHQHGIHFAFATGRHHLDVAKLHQYVGIPAFMVTSNGACIHAPDGSVIYQNFLDEALCAEIIALFENQPIFGTFIQFSSLALL
ncbi:cofprotein, HD superfamily hydrolase [Vibrio ishigakensis]|uniref:Cofprotein, HD superfamily hydrolase n=1 Tax=Vibrio ishigakensis TaxID=1481914 RepID=A0A0B8NVI8_9VIBR|nr:cofprotein, HD superfamily hydrolase [Vibrio ishigakensis]